MAHVFVTGMAVQDFVFYLDEMPAGGEKFRAQGVTVVGGGCAANAAVAVARLGGRASLAARLGQDSIGDMILSDLKSEGVNLDCIHLAPMARSAISSIYVTRDGERQIINFRGEGLVDDPGFLEFPDSIDVAMADTRWVAGAKKTMEIAKSRGIPGIIDAEAPVKLEQIAEASHITFSRQGLSYMTGEADVSKALRAVSTVSAAWICVTEGSAGVYFMDGKCVENIPAYPVKAIDTLAAGDIWHGAFALRLAEGSHERDAVEFANAAAALKCTHLGGRQGCPDRKTTETFIMENARAG